MTKAWTVRPPCLRGTYSWCRGEASRRDLAQACAWIGDVARGRSRAAARSLRARGMVIGTVIVMGRSLVRSVRDGQDGGDDLWTKRRLSVGLLYFVDDEVSSADCDDGGCGGNQEADRCFCAGVAGRGLFGGAD